MSNDKVLSISDVIRLPHDSWINGGFSGVVRSIEAKNSPKSGKPFWKVALGEQSGASTVKATFYLMPRFVAGDMVEFTGQGLKFKNGQYGPEVSIGDKAAINILGKSVHHEEQVERKANSEPAINGQLQPVAGQTVGMAMKEALTALVPGNAARMNTSGFWMEVHQFASDVIRVSRQLEAGKLAPSVKERTAPKPAPQPSPPPPRHPAVTTTEKPELEEDVPF